MRINLVGYGYESQEQGELIPLEAEVELEELTLEEEHEEMILEEAQIFDAPIIAV